MMVRVAFCSALVFCYLVNKSLKISLECAPPVINFQREERTKANAALILQCGAISLQDFWRQWNRNTGALCVQMDFMRTFEANTKCNNINYVWSHFYQILVVLKYHRRLWNSIFDADISRRIIILIKAKYTPLMWVFMHLKMSVSKILFHRRLWYFRTTKIW